MKLWDLRFWLPPFGGMQFVRNEFEFYRIEMTTRLGEDDDDDGAFEMHMPWNHPKISKPARDNWHNQTLQAHWLRSISLDFFAFFFPSILPWLMFSLLQRIEALLVFSFVFFLSLPFDLWTIRIKPIMISSIAAGNLMVSVGMPAPMPAGRTDEWQ